jgi:hypothetical protein
MYSILSITIGEIFMQFKYETYVVVNACAEYIRDNKPDTETHAHEFFEDHMSYEHIFRHYETLVRLTLKPSSILLDEYDLELLGDYLHAD